MEDMFSCTKITDIISTIIVVIYFYCNKICALVDNFLITTNTVSVVVSFAPPFQQRGGIKSINVITPQFREIFTAFPSAFTFTFDVVDVVNDTKVETYDA